MIDDLLIINESGALLFNWHPEEVVSDGQDDLLSGFLTAIDSFATFERGEDIKSLKLKETSIIFEKFDKFNQKLTFVVTTKTESLIELLHAFIHEIMEEFTHEFDSVLNKDFNGEVTHFQRFKQNVDKIIRSLGLDVLNGCIEEVDMMSNLKSVIYLEPKGGTLYFVYAKQYINREKISFLIPLVMNSARLLYQNNLNEPLHWIILNTVKNESITVEKREKILIISQYVLPNTIEEEFLSLEFFKNKEKYVKKPKKLIPKFELIKWDSDVKQIYLVDLVGKILYSKVFDESFDCTDYIPETIGFLTSTKKTSEEVFNRILFNSAIGGEKLITIIINFNNFALTLIGDIHDYNDYTSIQKLCIDIYKQLK
jgi:hypothetical protein